jgi:NAD(P)-dependent dehydrogenase (short-subunit alcohol dehydrogenase family)
MPKTIFITGASSGIGKTTVEFFADKGWQVVATMRNPAAHDEMNHRPNVLLLPLDVNDALSVARAVDAAIAHCGKVDVLVNNAGFAVFGAFENASEEQVFEQFNTNVFGAMRLTRALLPHFRAQKSGTIINVTSVAGRITSPLYSLYCSSKFALEGFTEALYYELRPFGVKTKLVEPGPIKTNFNGASRSDASSEGLNPYADIHERVSQFYGKVFDGAESPRLVAATIFKAANSSCHRLRYVAGKGGKTIIALSRFMPLWKFRWLQRLVIGI